VVGQLTNALERLRTAVAATPVVTGPGPLPVTGSVGIAHLRADDHDLDTLLARADTARLSSQTPGSQPCRQPLSQRRATHGWRAPAGRHIMRLRAWADL
jgi:GGDEF domain-containing protein